MQFHLDDQERLVLISEILEYVLDFPVESTIKSWVAYVEVKAELPVVGQGMSNRTYIEKAIEICCHSGYSLDPPALLNILDNLVDVGKPEADKLLRARLMNPPRQTNATHPLEAQLLYDRLPFANRTRLRQILREFNTEANFKKILHIEGGSGSGRSWTSQLIEYHCASTEGHLHCEGSVTEDNGSSMGPRELARDLATKLGAEPSTCPPLMTNEDAYITDLAQWVISAANERQMHLNGNRRRVWFVFDGFRQGVLREDTAKFLVDLARQCTSGVAAQLHRVVFCEFDFDVASRIKLKVQKYDIEPVNADDIRQILSSVITANPNIPATQQDEVISEALSIVTGTAVEPFTDLSEIGVRLQQVIEESMS